ncbi:SSU ribosomal protein S1p [hydrothermal vent metagenome]|uniref:Small ribosomal subunit protein bS1 n=1 Tax=hydrothermal vent metagenome TaxID=652676 RepID=A0A3B1CU16_9ZZZZ|nr:30S ribosomal protein S1 [Candidatus Manganitrophaceae bacterium]
MSKVKRKRAFEVEAVTEEERQNHAAQEALYAATFQDKAEGSVLEGTILAFEGDSILVDVGYKSEGMIPKEEFKPEEYAELKVGGLVTVYLEEREDADGNIVLSKEKADRMRIWKEIEEIYNNEAIVEAKVLSRIKGGMIVDIGVKAFLPGSQIDLRPVRNLERLIGETYPMKIIKMNHKRGNIVVSRRVLLEESRDKRRALTLSSLREGQVIEGVVKNITEYGAFIDLGGIDGLLHITDMSWGRVGHPSELFIVGDKVSVVVLKYDKTSGRVSLGTKQKTPDPWGDVESKYSPQTKVLGKVVSLTDYGAFVELEPGIEGLVHISEMSWAHEVKHPSRLVSVGDEVGAVILSVDRKARKISLGMKQIEPNPWDLVERQYPPGTVIKAKEIRSITDFGVFVGLEEGIDGLIHISDISWTRHVKHPSEIFKKGQEIDAVVLKVDRDKERISLGYKQLSSDPWEADIPKRFRKGNIVKGKVTKITDFGVFLELDEGVEGLVHISETGVEPPNRLEDVFHIGNEVETKVARIDLGERKIALTIKGLTRDSDKSALDTFHQSQGNLDQSLGAMIASKMKETTEGE